MEEFKSFLKSRKIALIISAVYVGMGTLAVSSIYGGDYLFGNWAEYVLLITFPVTIISFWYRYLETDYLPVLIIQFIMFILTFLFLSIFIKTKVKD